MTYRMRKEKWTTYKTAAGINKENVMKYRKRNLIKKG